jgi:acyl-[acyl-carrier-protein]-phospholipid O-acyltransferase/long-chain-fatty-acid--[acyl-carrier-protein] ligase
MAFRLPNTNAAKCVEDFKLKEYVKGRYLFRNMSIIRHNKEIFTLIIALGLFWSISQVVLAIFGEYAKSKLGITNAIVVQGVMALSVIGIILGSIYAASFAKYYINVGISALSAIGITLVILAIPFTTSIAVLGFEFAMFGLFSGLLMVPINARIQFLSIPKHLGTILAGTNFVQTIFMFLFLMLTTAFAYMGMDAEHLFDIMILVGLYLSYKLMKNYFVMAFWSFWEAVLKFRYKFVYEGLENIPKDKSVLLMGNHVSWLDWFIVQLPIERRINFMIDKNIYHWKLIHPFLKKGELIPVSPRASKDAFHEASQRLKEGRIVGIFPEGEITHKGKLGKFHRGFEYIELGDAVIVPFYIDGMFGSLFARYKKKNSASIFGKRVVNVRFGKAITEPINADKLQKMVENLKR